MRLSEERIASICNQILERLDDEGVVKLKTSPSKVRTEIERVVIGDLKILDEIEREATQFVRRSRNAPPEGSDAFDIAVRRHMETLAQKRNYVL